MSQPMMFDSDEEKYFSWYLKELEEAGFVAGWGRPDTIELATNVRVWSKRGKTPKPTVLLRNQQYTPDFKVTWTQKAVDAKLVVELVPDEGSDSFPESYAAPFMAGLEDKKLVSYIEIKGGFVAHDEGRIYSILSKWTFQLLGVYVQRVSVSTAPDSIFAKTFCPDEFRLTDKTRKPRKLRFIPRTLGEFAR